MSTNTNTDLSLAIAEEQLQPETRENLLASFGPLFQQAKQWRERAERLVVTDASQTDLMKQAREARLALKALRVEANKVRKDLKEDSIRKGRAIQGVYNVIEYLVKPLEDHLQEQENFIAIQEAKRREALQAKRYIDILPYGEFVPINLDWGGMSEEEYTKLLKSGKQQLKDKQEAAARAEAERVAAELAAAEERRRIREENSRLRAEAAEREAQWEREREERRKVEAAALADLRKAHEQEAKERAEAERLAAEDRKRQEEILVAERRQREAAERELERRRKEEEAAAAAAYAAEQLKKSAPDRERLQSFLTEVNALAIPSLQSDAGKRIAQSIARRVDEFTTSVEADLKQL